MPNQGEPAGNAVKRASEHASQLARLELELAQLELKSKASKLSTGAALGAGAAVLALFGFGFGLAAIAVALSNVVDTWLALVIVFGALVLLAALLGLFARRELNKGGAPVPRQAVEEARRTTQVLKSNGR
jgi:membrane protein implicated in regulation of membrane protease activity